MKKRKLRIIPIICSLLLLLFLGKMCIRDSIRNILRLTGGTGTVISLGTITVDTVKGIASKNGKDLYLSALEYRLLLVFLNNRGRILSRTQLLEAIWDIAGEFVNDNTLTVYIKRLREKIEDDPQNPDIIKTVRGLGYKVEI